MTVVAAVGCLLVPSAFRSTVVNAETLTKSFLFIPCEARSGKIFPVYSIGWTLNLEMFFYVLFYCGMRISHKHRGLITAAVTGILVILGQALTPQDTVLRFWTQAELVNFVIGIGIYGVEKEVGNIWMDRRICLVGIAISLVMLFSGKYLMKGHFSFLWNTLWGGAMLFLSLPIKDMPANQYLTHLGDMSYSIYLTHFMVIGVICRILIDNKVYSIKNTVIVVTAIGISLACAGIAYRFIETPFYVRRRMDKRFPKSGNKLETEE